MWTSFRNGQNNCGVSRYSGMVNNQLQVSKVHIGGIIWGTAIIDFENNVYVGSSNRLFVCIRPNGSIKWKYTLKRLPDSLIDSAAAFVGKHLILVPGGDGFIHALNIGSGKLEWLFSPPEKKTSDMVVNSFEGNIQVDKIGRVFAGCDNGFFYCLDGFSGNMLWSFETQMMIWSCGCMILEDKFIVFGSLDRYVYMIDVATGKCVSKYKTNAEIKSSPVCFNNKVVICNSNGEVYCFDVSTMQLKVCWIHDFDTEIYSSPAVKNGTLIIAKMDGEIVALDIENKVQFWEIKTDAPFCSSPIISDNNIVFIGSSNGKLYAFDLFYQRMLGYFDTTIYYAEDNRHYRKNLNASPALDEHGNIHIGGYDGWFYKIPSYLCLKYAKSVVVNKTLDPVCLDIIKQFKLQINDTPKAAISTISFKNPEQFVPYNIIVSSDGKYVNFIPKQIEGLDYNYKFDVYGSYFFQSDRWWKDRLNILGKRQDFVTAVELPAIKFKTTAIEDMKYQSIICWDIWDMFSTQPRILDTYIPAAMNAMGYTTFAFGFYSKRDGRPGAKYFKMLFLPSLPALEENNEAFLFHKDPSKVLLVDAEYFGGIIFTKSKSKFVLSVMGGTLPFDTFNTFIVIDEDDFSMKCDFYSKASCLSIKGNGKDYKFSSDVVNQLCDPKMNVISIGSFKGKYRKINPETELVNVFYNDNTMFIKMAPEVRLDENNIIIIVEFDNLEYSKLYTHTVQTPKLALARRLCYSYLVIFNDIIVTLISQSI